MRSVKEIKSEMSSFDGDKRSSAYKELKEELARVEASESSTSSPSKGLGDDIEKVLEVTGIAKVAKTILGDDCGCEARKNKLNQMFPRGTKQLRCFTQEEAEKYGVFMATREEGKLSKTEVDYLLAIYKEIYGKTIKIRRMGCYSCQMKGFIKSAISNLDKSYKLATEE